MCPPDPQRRSVFPTSLKKMATPTQISRPGLDPLRPPPRLKSCSPREPPPPGQGPMTLRPGWFSAARPAPKHHLKERAVFLWSLLVLVHLGMAKPCWNQSRRGKTPPNWGLLQSYRIQGTPKFPEPLQEAVSTPEPQGPQGHPRRWVERVREAPTRPAPPPRPPRPH